MSLVLYRQMSGKTANFYKCRGSRYTFLVFLIYSEITIVFPFTLNRT